MASKSFTLADGPEDGGKAPCGKCCIYTCILAVVGLLGFAEFYFYQNNGSCSYPELDENGLSNWTSGSSHIAYACFPGYFLEGESNLVVGQCEDGLWNPPPPSCNSLPLRIDCHINNQSLTGNITMWQSSASAPTLIYGLINYTSAIQPQGHVMQHVILSKRTCNVSHTIPEHSSHLLHPLTHTHTHPNHPEHPPHHHSRGSTTSSPSDSDSSSSSEEEVDLDDTHEEIHGKFLRIKFNSSALFAFKKAEVFMNIIFVDQKTTATLVSVHQENLTLVMTSSDPVHAVNSTWNMDKETRALFEQTLPV